MPRQNRRQVPAPRNAAPSSVLGQRSESWRGIEYSVRTIAGTAATKPYRCPGCDQEIPPGQPHLVCWPADDHDAEDRRHWHSVCWTARDRRAPTVQRGRGAPRY